MNHGQVHVPQVWKALPLGVVYQARVLSRQESRCGKASLAGKEDGERQEVMPSRSIDVFFRGDAMTGPIAGTSSGVDIFPTLVTPDMVRAKAAQVDAYIQGIDADVVKNAANLTNEMVANWQQFHSSWNAFYQNQIVDSTVGVFLGAKGLLEQTEQYERDAKAWQEELRKRGVATTVPPPTLPPPDEGHSTIRTVAVAGAVIVGGVVVLLMVKR